MPEITVAGRTFQVRELTVGEVRAWMRANLLERTSEIDVIDDGLLDGVGLSAIRACTGTDSLDELTPSGLELLGEKCREVNAHFFGLLVRLTEAGRRIVRQQSELSSSSTAPSASS